VRGPSSTPCRVGFPNRRLYDYTHSVLLVSLPGSFVFHMCEVQVHCICSCVYEGIPIIVGLFDVAALSSLCSFHRLRQLNQQPYKITEDFLHRYHTQSLGC
jgi:hypothetical protein